MQASSHDATIPQRCLRLEATAREQLALVEHELPAVPPPGFAIVRIDRTLISAGTELAKTRGLTAGSFPLPLGYSATGTVIAVAPDEETLAAGDRVCANAPHATHAVVPVQKLAKLPDGVSLDDGTFGTLGALTLYAVRLAKIEIGESCAVVGFGIVGQLIALWASLAGAKDVTIIEHRPYREALARSLGFAVKQDGEYPVVFEAAGSTSSLNEALARAQRGGRVVVAGSARESTTIDVYRDVHLRGVSLIGAHGSLQGDVSTRWNERKNRETTLGFIANERLPVGRLISHRLNAVDFEEGFRLLKDRAANAVVLTWPPKAQRMAMIDDSAASERGNEARSMRAVPPSAAPLPETASIFE